MAEGFFNQNMGEKGTGQSVLVLNLSKINPPAVQVMKEVSIDDLRNQKSKIITQDMIRSSAKSVNMGCIDKTECPMLFINNMIDLGIEDPKGKPIDAVIDRQF